MKKTTRRDLLGTIGFAASTFVLSGCLNKALAATPQEAGKSIFPWPYAKLNPDYTAEKVYTSTYHKGCMSRCPQDMPIGKAIAEAVSKLA